MKERPFRSFAWILLCGACAAPAEPEEPLDPLSNPGFDTASRNVRTAREPSPDEVLLRRLDTTQVAAFQVRDEESLRTVVEAFRVMTGLPIVVTDTAENAALDEGVVFDLNLEHPISARNLLQVIVDLAGDEVHWTVRHDILLVTASQRSSGGPQLRLYDIRHLTLALTDFRAPSIDRLRLLDEIEDATGGVAARTGTMSAEDVLDLVRTSIAQGTWDDEGLRLAADNGFLIVVHEPSVHREVERLLERLGR